MADNTKCPECQCEFQIKYHLKYRLRATPSFLKLAFDNIAFPWRNGFEEIYKPHLVVCPGCGNEFSASEYRYFGFIKIKHLQVGLIFFFLLFMFAPIAIMLWNITK